MFKSKIGQGTEAENLPLNAMVCRIDFHSWKTDYFNYICFALAQVTFATQYAVPWKAETECLTIFLLIYLQRKLITRLNITISNIFDVRNIFSSATVVKERHIVFNIIQ